MASKIYRLLREPKYRVRVFNYLRLLISRPKAIASKSDVFFRNKLNRLDSEFHNREKVHCNVCGWRGNRFNSLATLGYVRHNAFCPQCGSLERHRAMIAWLNDSDLISKGITCLDVGGIQPFQMLFQSIGVQYVSISLDDPAMVHMDVERLAFPTEQFDLILDSHVLEYVSDYRRATQELWRVLRVKGTLLLTEAYQFGNAQTIEFGRPKPEATFMVRQFGDDLQDLLSYTGFHVNCFDYTGRNDASGDYIFICQK